MLDADEPRLAVRARDFVAPRVLFFAVDRLAADFDEVLRAEARLVVLFVARPAFFAVLLRVLFPAVLFFAVLLRPAFFAVPRFVADLRVIVDDAPFLAVERLEVDLRDAAFLVLPRFDADFLVVAAM
jgi:hypothetical protein